MCGYSLLVMISNFALAFFVNEHILFLVCSFSLLCDFQLVILKHIGQVLEVAYRDGHSTQRYDVSPDDSIA
jgi:hypothetical protein